MLGLFDSAHVVMKLYVRKSMKHDIHLKPMFLKFELLKKFVV